MRSAKKVLLWLAALIGVPIFAVVLVQAYYYLTPVSLSLQSQALQETANRSPPNTDNGYRFYGLLAPADVDPVKYGRCIAAADELHEKEKRKLSAEERAKEKSPDGLVKKQYMDERSARSDALRKPCAEGKVPFPAPDAVADEAPILPGFDWDSLVRRAANKPDPVLLARSLQVMAGGSRYIQFDSGKAPLGSYETLATNYRWQVSHFASQWQQVGLRREAATIAVENARAWRTAANGSTADVEYTSAALNTQLLVIQAAVARLPRQAVLDNETAESLLAAIGVADTLPQALSDALAIEWAIAQRKVRGAFGDGIFSTPSDIPVWASLLASLVDWNDTANLQSPFTRHAQELVLSASTSLNAPKFDFANVPELSSDCYEFGWRGIVCVPFTRNPYGRLLGYLSIPATALYGRRIHDVRNMAAAARLTVEARRRRLSGTALSRFVADAPAGMRDVFTDRPFVYDATTGQLVVERREATRYGGKAGPYALIL